MSLVMIKVPRYRKHGAFGGFVEHYSWSNIRTKRKSDCIPPVTRATLPDRSGISASALKLLRPNIVF